MNKVNEMVSEEKKEEYRKKADIFRALSNPVRLCILTRLIESGKLNVSMLSECMCVSQSNVSQHLSKLRALGIVKAEKTDNQVFYSCDKEEIIRVITALG